MRPNFIGIGAQKCATTWLHAILSDHPEACLGPSKEINFFSYYYDYGFQWYERQFDCAGNPLAVGEISPSYFHASAVPERVFSYDRAMRLILFLRDPVERALSNHKHEVRTGHLSGTDLSFESGLRNNPSYVEQGRYATHLERWLAYFPRAQLHVLLFEDIVANPGAAARGVYEFLQIDGSHLSTAVTARSNEGYVNRYMLLRRMRMQGKKALRALRLEWIWLGVAHAGGRRLYRAINRADAKRVIPPLADSTRQMLKSEFRGEIQRLERLLGRSLQHWL
jgi:Sulfotransferase domain